MEDGAINPEGKYVQAGLGDGLPLYFQCYQKQILLNDELHDFFLIKDVTDSIMAERNKQQSYYQDLLIMTVSHEMRNPLNCNFLIW